MTDLYFGFDLQSALISFVFAWVILALLKHFVAKHSLDNIPGPPSPSFYSGNFTQIFNRQGWEFHRYLNDVFGGVVQMKGFWGAKQLLVTDPKALHHILVKDQYIYEEPAWVIEGNKLIFGCGLLGTLGEHHRKQRKLLNPVFSLGHLRDVVPTFYQVSYKLRDAIASELKGCPRDIDLLHWTSRAALELIGQSGLGYSFGNFDESTADGPTNEYRAALKDLVPTMFEMNAARRMIPYLSKLGPPGFRRAFITLLPFKSIQKLRKIVDTMDGTSAEIFQSKKAALQQGDEAVLKQVGRGKDIMSILLKANIDAKEEFRLPESELIAQMTTLLFAATDTTSAALARILHVLAQHPDVQNKLRQEITESRLSGEELDYNALTALPYLDAVIRETMRLFPPAPFPTRTARKDIILPLFKPIVGRDGTAIREIVVPKNTNIIISVLGANRNPDIWGEDAYEWKPERWLAPLPDSVIQAHFPAVYSNQMTFIGGGRACIGFKFSELEMKTVLSVVLQSFSFSLTEQEIVWNMIGIVSPAVKGDPPGDKTRSPLWTDLRKPTKLADSLRH